MRIVTTLVFTYCSCFGYMALFNLIVGGLFSPLCLLVSPAVVASIFLVTGLSDDVPRPAPAPPPESQPVCGAGDGLLRSDPII